jgi:lysozyme family protein
MAAMPQEFARSVYVRRYIEGPGFDAILTVPLCDPIAEEVVDTGVNMGPVVAGEFLQRCLNAFNKGGTAYADVPVDGRVGPGTIAALQAYVKLRGATGVAVLLRALNCLQGARYIAIADKDQRQEDFVYGWIANRVV